MAENQSAGMICDCHIHSFSKSAPTGESRYVPPPMDIADYAKEARPLGISRAIVVQASVDGTDNSRLVEVLKGSSEIALRGVAMIDPENVDLQVLHDAGVRAIRVQDRARLGESDLHKLQHYARCASDFGWHLELNTEPTSFAEIAAQIARMPDGVSLVMDHIAHIDPAKPEDMDALRRLLDSGRVWVKLSPTRVSHQIGRYDDLLATLQTIAECYSTKCIWGSDWPHVMTAPPLPEIPPMLELLRQAMSAEQLHACLWSNPEKLYGFSRKRPNT